MTMDAESPRAFMLELIRLAAGVRVRDSSPRGETLSALAASLKHTGKWKKTACFFLLISI